MNDDLRKKAARIKLALFDIDGVLTDGVLYYGEQGLLMQAFHAHDGHGIKMLMQEDIKVGVISARRSIPAKKRLEELGVEIIHQGISDKQSCYLDLVKSHGLTLEATSYMGDDTIDIPVLLLAGLSVSVPEAPSSVKESAMYITTRPGGKGAVREWCDILLEAR